MALVNVDIDLNDFDIDEIIDHLVRKLSRMKTQSPKEFQLIVEQFKNDLSVNLNVAKLPNKTLEDNFKHEHLFEIWDKYTSNQFEALLPK